MVVRYARRIQIADALQHPGGPVLSRRVTRSHLAPRQRNFRSHLPAVLTPFDALLHVFLLGWGWHGLTTHPLEVFSAPIFHPEVRTLTYMDHMLGEAALAGPIIEVFGLGAGYNFLIGASAGSPLRSRSGNLVPYEMAKG